MQHARSCPPRSEHVSRQPLQPKLAQTASNVHISTMCLAASVREANSHPKASSVATRGIIPRSYNTAASVASVPGKTARHTSKQIYFQHTTDPALTVCCITTASVLSVPVAATVCSFVMVAPTVLRLGAPLFLFALVIVRHKWESIGPGAGPEPPKIQTVLAFTRFNCSKSAARSRKIAAMAAIKTVAFFFVRAGLAAPAGVCSDAPAPQRLDHLASWLSLLAGLDPTEAISILVSCAHCVPASVYRRVESEFNAGIRSCNTPAFAHLYLEPDTLSQRVIALQHSLPDSTRSIQPIGPAVRPYEHHGTFYYIGAGVGCGIREIQQVRSPTLLFVACHHVMSSTQ
jgi:hypothetical protein